MAVTQLDLARQEHEQASRNVRRLMEQKRHQSSASLDGLLMKAKERQQKAAAELTRLLDGLMFAPQATRPDGAESRPIESNPSQPIA